MPHQVFAIGLNYRSHGEESGMAIPDVPATFTKFPASLAGPFDDIGMVGESTGLGGGARGRRSGGGLIGSAKPTVGPTSPG